MMTRYRKKPVTIEAVQLLWENWNEMCEFVGVDGENTEGVYVDENNVWHREHTFSENPRIGLLIHTLEGQMLATEGDWVIRGVQGELYPCKPDIFEQTYERVDDED